MSNISASLVKELRDKTGAGMMDCKNALNENNGDIESSIDWLRTKGLAKAAKKSGRVASEGLIAVSSSDDFSAIIEVNSETDFVARNDIFQNVASKISSLGLMSSSIDDLKEQNIDEKDMNVESYITEMISSIGENINLRRMTRFDSSNSNVSTYIHGQVNEGLGKIGVMVNLKSDAEKEALSELGKKIAMHIAATNPLSVSIEDIPSDVLERERNILIEEARESGKPEDIIENMIDGRLKKFYQESVLLEQTYVIDGESKVSSVLQSLGSPVEIIEFVRYELGEGIEKASDEDFASEVDSMVSGN
jgi:elongation factor Ts